uniref:Uncharacterized protein n=1 Tax=Anopheles culicifacies TaxID=139723 RepID=A0A182LTZ5_9DIPT
MRLSETILLYTLVLSTTNSVLVNAFVKLVAIGHKIELKNNFRSINISYNFRIPKRLVDQTIDFEIDITRQIKDMKLVLAYYSGPKNVTNQNALLKRHVDLCFFLRNPKSDRLVNVVYSLVKDNGNMPTKCPFGPGKFYMRNLKPASLPIPLFLPEADFIFELIYRSEVRLEPLVEFRFYGRMMRIIDKLFKIDFKFNAKVFNLSYYFHQPTLVTNQSLEFQIQINQKIKDMKLLLIYHGMTRNGTVSSVLLRRQVDLCAFLRNTKSDRLVKSMYDYVNARSHIPTRCPFIPGYYYMCNLRLADVPIPGFLPETDFLLEVIYFSGVRSQPLVEFRLYASSYYMHNLRLADVPLPALLPESEFMTELAYYTGIKQEIAVSFRLYGKLVRIIENIMPIMQ